MKHFGELQEKLIGLFKLYNKKKVLQDMLV